MRDRVQRALVIGGGFSGMSAAIQLRKVGVDVDLVEIDPDWRSYGAGITVVGAALRAFRTLGVLDRFLQEGAATDGLDVCAPHGPHLARLSTPRVAGPDLPGGGGIMRPVLAKILADATRASGAKVRLGCTFKSISQDADGVDVGFTDGSTSRYDLVVGADGLYSDVRQAVMPDAPAPRYSGQGVWRAVLPRPPEIERAVMWVGPAAKPGLNPVSRDQMYLFVTETRPVNERLAPERLVATLKDVVLGGFTAPLLQWVREQLSEDSLVVYRPLLILLVPRPWHRGRVVLIGDAVHATTPHLAAGACIGIEDAIVLAEEIGRGDGVEQALERFQARRWERCRMVVENSARLGEIEIADGDKEEHSRIMVESMAALSGPI